MPALGRRGGEGRCVDYCQLLVLDPRAKRLTGGSSNVIVRGDRHRCVDRTRAIVGVAGPVLVMRSGRSTTDRAMVEWVETVPQRRFRHGQC